MRRTLAHRHSIKPVRLAIPASQASNPSAGQVSVATRWTGCAGGTTEAGLGVGWFTTGSGWSSGAGSAIRTGALVDAGSQ